ncbi:uncharacterized protein DNG_02064 [Cephalotrichum gorgonifer]|uniref:Copper-fist domain-containing protein n=1 Tax=Cephalotrichum gorgonifer TaxID=2041049 RepID=A0AAE8SSC5_9PEZI|nr:uncharacterized protein DNG_02064 [Cephalotrichum gorgonifer]
MIIDGEKYACEACVRGHRVSNCQHSDRPLQHINKKGRPVSQCGHCRTLRKSRSAHVKCDCGIKPNKCIHLQPNLDGHASTCCCNHGGICTCSCSSDVSTTHPAATGDDSLSRSKSSARARRASAAIHSPPRSAVSKSAPRSRNPMTQTRVGSISARRRSAAALHGLSGGSQGCDSGDTTPENVTESGSPPPSDSTGNSLPDHDLSPLDMSRIAAFPPYMHTNGFDLLSLGGGFSDSEGGPLYSAGLATPSNMWGNSDFFMAPAYDGLSRDQMFDFTSAVAPDQYSEQSSDQLPNLAVASSGEVSEADDHHSPGALDANADFFQDRSAGDFERTMTRPEIFDDTPLYYTFDDELQALGYSEEGHSAEKRPEYNSYWAASP